MDEKVDLQLGTAIKLLYHRGEHKAMNLLLSAKDLLWEWDSDQWDVNYYRVGIVLDIDLFDEYNDNKVINVARWALADAMKSYGEGVSEITLYPAPVSADWRKDIEATLRGETKEPGKPCSPARAVSGARRHTVS